MIRPLYSSDSYLILPVTRDYVDCGNFSLECITILFALKVLQPNKFYLIRGNHEIDIMCSQYGFKDEILNYHNPKKMPNAKQEQVVVHNHLEFHFDDEKGSKDTKTANETEDSSKPNTKENEEYEFYHNHMFCYQYTEKLYEAFIKSFSFLPVCAIINKTNFCIHGGLSPRLQNVDQHRKQIKRPITTFEGSRLFSDVLWSDPTSNFQALFCDNPRGRGYLFNSDSTYNFLNTNLFTRLIRGHQCVKHGSRTNFSKKCITVFSASSYSDEFVNKSGILQLYEKDDQIEYTSFQPLDRLEKNDAIYYKVEAFQIEKNDRCCFSFRHPKLHAENSCSLSPYKTSRAIKAHQSVRLAKPLFRTFSKKAAPSIARPKISHSTSLSDISSKEYNSNKEMTRSIYSLDNLADFADNM